MSALRQFPTESARTIFLSAGAVLKIYSSPYYTHYGIYVGDGMVIHNSKERGEVVLDTYDDFARNREVYPSDITSDNLDQAVAKAWDCLGKPYDLFGFNCEHFVRYCHGLPIKSHQKQKYIIAGSALTIVAKASSPTVRKIAGGIGLVAILTSETEEPAEKVIEAGLGIVALLILSQL